MPRPRKPAAINEFDGNPSRRPIRKEPPSGGVPIKPRGMGAFASAYWDRYVPRLIECGIVGYLDTPALVELCEWSEKLHQAKKVWHDDATNLQIGGLCSMCLKHVSKMWSTLGMTPVARANLAINPPEAENDLDAYLQEAM